MLITKTKFNLAFIIILLLLPAFSNAGTIHTYYIAADEVEWDYGPLGCHVMAGDPSMNGADTYLQHRKDRIGRFYLKAQYREYTDGSFSKLKPISKEWEHLGILGPVLRAGVGDTLEVVFKNNTRFPLTMHPHGMLYDKKSEGIPDDDKALPQQKMGGMVGHGEIYHYTWRVPPSAGPGPNDPSSIVWLYHSHVDTTQETNAGLIGAIIISKGKIKDNGMPVDVDREFITLFKIFDENDSLYLDINMKKYLTQAPDKKDADFIESNLKHSINGYIFSNVPGLVMKEGERVRWYLIGLGNEDDLHTPHWHGNTVLWEGHRTDVVELLPASMKVADMMADNVGTWMFHCHVDDHMKAGMTAMYTVLPKDTKG